jgi:acetoin utilization deacetylase AcuC-like enzyme
MSLTVFASDRFADHLTPPGHPERVQRAEVMQVVASEFRRRGGAVVEPRAVTENELARVHDREYIMMIRELAGRTVALDPDTFTSPKSYDVACLSAGAAVLAVDHVLNGGRGTRGFAMIRPPGHHAEHNRAMGFCLFNNIACAAAHARSRGLSRVAIVDYDVHHGNGTQSTFYDDPSVLFISLHQFPFYPGTGAANEIGDGAGRGFTVNLPIEADATDADYELLFRRVVLPVLAQYRPQLILISAGFDAHMDDPLGGMRLTTGQFGRLTSMLTDTANEHCEGRVVAVTEGGYDLTALTGSLRAVVGVLAADAALEDFERPSGSTQRGEDTLKQFPSELSRHWTI